jgi:phage recombination protein Bet
VNTELVHHSANGVATATGFTSDQVELIKRNIAQGSTDDELALFIHQAERAGLDPFSHQIWFTKRSGKMSILTGIDGYRLIADRTGRYAGQDGPYWCGENGQWTDVWLQPGHPAAAKVTVLKIVGDGTVARFTGIALWSEYGAHADGFMWKPDKMPAAQLAKCSEALALRKAFPAEMSGMYVKEEMDQAAAPDRGTVGASRPPVGGAAAGNGKPVEASRSRRQPPAAARRTSNDVGAVMAEVPPEVRADLAARIEALGPLGRVWIEEQAQKRGIGNVKMWEFGPPEVVVVEALLKQAARMDAQPSPVSAPKDNFNSDEEPF